MKKRKLKRRIAQLEENVRLLWREIAADCAKAHYWHYVGGFRSGQTDDTGEGPSFGSLDFTATNDTTEHTP